jgi:hypothetical protein
VLQEAELSGWLIQRTTSEAPQRRYEGTWHPLRSETGAGHEVAGCRQTTYSNVQQRLF